MASAAARGIRPLYRTASLHNNGRSLRCLSSSSKVDFVLQTYKVSRRGDEQHGSPKEYLLLPPSITISDAQYDESMKACSLMGHRNVIFGARGFHDDLPLSEVGSPLVQAALEDASLQGEQPQALASLSGLCGWVSSCIDGESVSQTLNSLREDDPASFEAVQAVATGVPRKGHSVVGVGTYRDAEEGWKLLAKEFISKQPSEEIRLYQAQDAELVGIDHLADTRPDYLQTAGGAMARFFFV